MNGRMPGLVGEAQAVRSNVRKPIQVYVPAEPLKNWRIRFESMDRRRAQPGAQSNGVIAEVRSYIKDHGALLQKPKYVKELPLVVGAEPKQGVLNRIARIDHPRQALSLYKKVTFQV